MDSAKSARFSVGIDVGGTFTDLVARDEESGAIAVVKVATTPNAPQEGVLAALRRFLDQNPGASISALAHSTTIATNALLGQMHLELPRVALVTTEGFRDVIEIGRQNRSEVYNLLVTRPKPLVAREDRLAVRERMDFRGNVLVELDPDSLQRAIDYLRDQKIPSVAIGFLHSYANGAHERAAAAAISKALPDVAIAQSAVLDPEYREYERFSTAVVNAALLPIVSRYIEAIGSGLSKMGIDAPLYVMQSHGGMNRADRILSQPATIIESGPASGVIAAAAIGRQRGLSRVLSFDMGGTTAKAGTIVDGRPQVVTEFEAAGRTHSGRAMKGSGYPVRFPFIDLAEVSAGGGTIAWLDEADALHVGPISAGADPGPACYGTSDQATVTDANVVLGRLNQQALLGGTFAIDARRSRDAVQRLATQLNLSLEAAAAGIVRLVDTEMAKVLRIVTVERGLDPRDFTLVAFGGNGALHACALAEELGVRAIVVPQRAGLFSAYGLLVAPLQTAVLQSLLETDDRLADSRLGETFETLSLRAKNELLEQGAAVGTVQLAREYDLRYAGQSFELSVPAEETLAGSLAAFHQKHAATYGYSVPEERVEIVNARVIATVPTLEEKRISNGVVQPATPRPGTGRKVWFAEGPRDVAVFQRESLADGWRHEGPAIIEQYDACTYVAPGWNARMDSGDILMERSHAGA